MMIKETIKNLEKKNLIVSILLTILGLLLITRPIAFIKTIIIIVGIILFILSIIDFVHYFNSDQEINNINLFKGIIELIAAILLTFRNDVLIDLFPVILGVIIIFDGIFQLQIALNIKKVNQNDWVFGFVLSLVTIIIGSVIVFNPFKTLELILKVAGVVLVVSEVLSLIYSGIVLHGIKKVVETVLEEKEKEEEKRPKGKVIEAEIEEVEKKMQHQKRKILNPKRLIEIKRKKIKL